MQVGREKFVNLFALSSNGVDIMKSKHMIHNILIEHKQDLEVNRERGPPDIIHIS